MNRVPPMTVDKIPKPRRRRTYINATGRKWWWVPRKDGRKVLSPFARKELARRRAAGRAARASRRANR